MSTISWNQATRSTDSSRKDGGHKRSGLANAPICGQGAECVHSDLEPPSARLLTSFLSGGYLMIGAQSNLLSDGDDEDVYFK